MTLDERLERLERRSTRWRIVGLSATALLAIAVTFLFSRHRAFERELSHPKEPTMSVLTGHVGAGTIRAHRLSVTSQLTVGADGGSRVEIAAIGDGSQLTMLDSKGRVRLRLDVSSDEAPRVRLSSPDGYSDNTPVLITTGPNGDGFLTLRDREGRIRVITAKE